jgi:hypothetical protein
MVPHYDKLIAVMHYFSGRVVEANCLASVILLIIIIFGMIKLNMQISFVKICLASYVLQPQ